jgi:IclR family transcriptional regulator, acetate operon repressor
MSNVQSADRALAILAAFDEDRPTLRVTELATSLGMHKSTVSRLLATLHGRGLVRRDGEVFSPGPELARLGILAARRLDLTELAQEPLARLAEETGETVNLAVRQGETALNVHQVQSSHLIGLGDWSGRALPLHCTANGKALLAWSGDEPTDLPARTPLTITDRDRLREELDTIRERGWAAAVEELELGLVAVAAPFFDARGQVVAAVSLAAPAYRLGPEALADAGERCAATAREVSALLGFRPTSARN